MMLSFLLHVPWLLNDSLNKLACQVNIDSILNLEAYYKFHLNSGWDSLPSFKTVLPFVQFLFEYFKV